VKWKYDPHPRYDPDRVSATGEAPEAAGLISFWYFLLPTCIYILFTCLGFCVSFLPVVPEHPTPFSLGGWLSLTDAERLRPAVDDLLYLSRRLSLDDLLSD
jgi:hypothetical protein